MNTTKPPSARSLTETKASLIGAALAAIGSISMTLYTPAMPTLVEVFGAPVSTIKLSLTLYFAGYALCQLVAGPMSDAFGRRPVALSFLMIYLAASIAIVAAPGAAVLLWARLFQGIGAAATLAISRAVVRDLFTGQQSIRILNTIGLMLVAGQSLAPAFGGTLLQLFDWRAIFLFMAGYGAVLIGLIVFAIPETAPARNASLFHPRRLAANYAGILSNPRFLQPALAMCGVNGMIFAAATILPFVLIDRVGLTPVQYGFGMLAQSLSYGVGAVLLRFLVKRVDVAKMEEMGIVACIVSALLLDTLLATLGPHYLTVMGPIGLISFSLAFIQPGATTRALAPFRDTAGSAAALIGCLQIGGGFVGGLAAAALPDPLISLGVALTALAALAGLAHFGLGRLNARTALIGPH